VTPEAREAEAAASIGGARAAAGQTARTRAFGKLKGK
jgi:hypothetical protein